MTETEKAIRDFCGHHADWWPSTTQVQEMLALAQPEQEPVAWRAWVSKFPQGTGSDWVYVTKPIMKDSIHNQPLYTTPPQRTWTELTDEEIYEIGFYINVGGLQTMKAYKAIEAKLKEKNNG